VPVRVPVRLSAALLTGLLSLILPATPATDPDKPAIATGIQRERVDLVLVDVIVTDRKGRRVEDLRPGEFTLLVDGAPHAIESIELQRVAPPAGASAREAPDPGEGAPGPAPAGAGEDGVPVTDLRRSFILLFDGLNAEHGVRDQAIEAARAFVAHNLPPGEEVMIAALGRGLKIYREFTSDRDQLASAIETLASDPAVRRSGEDRLSREMDEIEEMDKKGGSMPPPLRPSDQLRSRYAWEATQRIRRTLGSLGALVAYLHPRPGKKELLFLSDGFASNSAAVYGASWTPGLEPEILRLAREAAAAQVAISTVNTRGMPAPGFPGVYGERVGTNTLATFALNTGGLAFHSTNRFETALLEVEEQGRSSYLLAFRPAGEPDDGLHSIRVVVSRKGCRVRATEGFVWLTPARIAEREMLSAFVSPELFGGLSVSLEAITYLEEGDRPALEIAVALADESLLFLPRRNHLVAQLETGWVLKADGGTAVDEFGRQVEVRLTREEFARHGDITFLARRNVPPGTYEAVAVVRDLGTGNIGAVRREVKVPALSAERMAVSSIVLSSLGERSRVVALDPAMPLDRKIGVPSVRRVFSRDAKVAAMCSIYHPVRDAATGQARLRFRASIRSGDGTKRELPAARRVFRPSEYGRTIPVSFPVPLAGLEPGVHTLEVQLLDEVGDSGVVQRVEFIVR
jgi:VWFA-related protein